MIRVLLIDDHVLVRSGLEGLLSVHDDIEVVGSADDGATAIDLVDDLDPDVILMDITMPEIDGIEATRRLREHGSAVSVIMLTAHSDRNRILSAIDAGADGYILKDAEASQLVDGVRVASRGQSPISPRAARAMIDSRADEEQAELTAREKQVLDKIGDGLSNKQIARDLRISEKTVKAHLTRIYSALGVSDRTQAALWLARTGNRQ